MSRILYEKVFLIRTVKGTLIYEGKSFHIFYEKLNALRQSTMAGHF